MLRAIIGFLLICTFTNPFYSQEIKTDIKNDKIIQGTEKVAGPQDITDEIKFKNEAGNAIITITDEGSNVGSITLPSPPTGVGFALPITNNKLYNYYGTLFFNGSALGSGGASQINDLSDAKYDGSSLFLGVGAGAFTESDKENVAVGKNALHKNTTGSYNTANGDSSLYSNIEGLNNTAVGYKALFNNTTGSGNTALGKQALYYNEEGDFNTIIGSYAGSGTSLHNKSGNVLIGYQAGYYVTSSGNVLIGYQAGYNVTSSNQLYIENSTSSNPLIWGDFSTRKVCINGQIGPAFEWEFYVKGDAGGLTNWNSASDRKLKTNINTIPNALERVKSLRGVNFEWKDKKTLSQGMQMGFIGQEVIEIIPEVVDDSGEYLTMQYAPITAILVEAIKEQQKIIDELRSDLEEVKKIIQNQN